MAHESNGRPYPTTVHCTRPCRLCRATLSAIERVRGDTCGRLASRHQAGRQRDPIARDAALARRRASAARSWGDDAAATAPVVWLEAHERRMGPVAPALRRTHLAHLRTLGAEREAAGRAPEPPAEIAPAGGAGKAALAASPCTFCAVRDGRHGTRSIAFITAALLRRWLARHPGSRAAGAAANYAARLPARHVEGSRLHHGARGCALPRELLSDVCSQCACTALQSLQGDTVAGRAGAVLAAMERQHTVEPAALLHASGFRRLPRLPTRNSD